MTRHGMPFLTNKAASAKEVRNRNALLITIMSEAPSHRTSSSVKFDPDKAWKSVERIDLECRSNGPTKDQKQASHQFQMLQKTSYASWLWA